MRAIGPVLAVFCVSLMQSQAFSASTVFYQETFNISDSLYNSEGYYNVTGIAQETITGRSATSASGLNSTATTGSIADSWSFSWTGYGRQRINRWDPTPPDDGRGGVLVLDDNSYSDSVGVYARNEAIVTLNLAPFAAFTNIELQFDSLDWYDDEHSLPSSSYTGSVDADGVSVSSNGVDWFPLVNFNQADGTWQTYTANISSLIASVNDPSKLSLTSTFQIKFQQYDNGTHTGPTGTYYGIDKRDARKFDNVALLGELKGTGNGPAPSVPEPATATLFGIGLLAFASYRRRRRMGEVIGATPQA